MSLRQGDSSVTGRPVRLAMCGTFDVENYGDMLFPLVLRHELGKRVPGIEVECFSYRAKTPPSWPYVVTPVSQLPEVVDSFDGMVIGGGHLIRFDKDVAPGYVPPAPAMHHPTSYWLFPALLAIEARVPLIWSAVGASLGLPAWGGELLREALRSSAYVSVRDDASRRELQKLCDDREVVTVPDTVFGIQDFYLAHHDPRSHREAARPYVVIQAASHLRPYADAIQKLALWLRHQGYDIVLLPIAPILGDDVKALQGVVGKPVEARPWTDPMEAVAMIAKASAVVGVSLHLSITAMAFGVPVLRPFQNALSKYYAIHDLPGVYPLERYAKQPERVHQGIAKGAARSAEVEGFCSALSHHWDRIATILTFPSPQTAPGLSPLLQRLPFWLEKGGR